MRATLAFSIRLVVPIALLSKQSPSTSSVSSKVPPTLATILMSLRSSEFFSGLATFMTALVQSSLIWAEWVLMTFELREVAQAFIMASLFERSNSIFIDSITLIASPAARWKASEILVGWMLWPRSCFAASRSAPQTTTTVVVPSPAL